MKRVNEDDKEAVSYFRSAESSVFKSKRIPSLSKVFGRILDLKTKHYKHALEMNLSTSSPVEQAFSWFRKYNQLQRATSSLYTYDLGVTVTEAGTEQQEAQVKQLNLLIDYYNLQGEELLKQGHKVNLIDHDDTDHYVQKMTTEIFGSTDDSCDDSQGDGDRKPAAVETPKGKLGKGKGKPAAFPAPTRKSVRQQKRHGGIHEI